MRSSAIIGLCLQAMEHRSDDWMHTQITEVIGTLILLLQEECAEQSRACLAFIRVCVSVLPVNLLTDLLPTIVSGTLSSLGHLKTKFTARVRSIIRKLSQRVSEESLRPLIPEEDLALYSYIQKQARRTKRKKTSRDELKLQELIGSGDEGDSSDDESDTEQKSARLASRPKATRAMDVVDSFALPASLDDLLEDQVSTFPSGHTSRPLKSSVTLSHDKGKKGKSKMMKSADDSEDEDYSVKLTAEGQLVVEEKDSTQSVSAETKKRADIVDRDSQKEKSKSNDASMSKKRKMKEPGEEYRSKKAGGDVWRSGMLEPHAYIPLDAKMLSMKNRREAVSHFGSVVTNGKKKRTQIVAKHARNKVIVGNRNQRKSVTSKGLDIMDDDD